MTDVVLAAYLPATALVVTAPITAPADSHLALDLFVDNHPSGPPVVRWQGGPTWAVYRSQTRAGDAKRRLSLYGASCPEARSGPLEIQLPDGEQHPHGRVVVTRRVGLIDLAQPLVRAYGAYAPDDHSPPTCALLFDPPASPNNILHAAMIVRDAANVTCSRPQLQQLATAKFVLSVAHAVAVPDFTWWWTWLRQAHWIDVGAELRAKTGSGGP